MKLHLPQFLQNLFHSNRKKTPKRSKNPLIAHQPTMSLDSFLTSEEFDSPSWSSTLRSPIKSSENSFQFHTRSPQTTLKLPVRKIPHRRSNVPLMGKSALFEKANKERNTSAIVHDLVLQKFGQALLRHRRRSLRRHPIKTSSQILEGSKESCSDSNRDESSQCWFEVMIDSEQSRLNAFGVEAPKEVLTVLQNTSNLNHEARSEIVVRENHYECLQFQDPLLLTSRFSGTDRSVQSGEISILLSDVPYDEYEFEFNDTKLMDEIAKQNNIVMQASKALNFCDSIKYFDYWQERIYAERILLLATLKCNALQSQLHKVAYDEICDAPKIIGTAEIYNIYLPQVYNPSCENSHETYVCILSHNTRVLASELVQVKNTQIRFQNNFVFKDLDDFFEITLGIYCMQTPRTLSPILEESNRTCCLSPKKLRPKKLEPPMLASTARQSSFELLGECQIRVNDLINPYQQYKLRRTSTLASTTLEHVFLKINSAVSIKDSKLKGWLAVGVLTEKCLFWHRRWCVLDGIVLKFWRYPTEENTAIPMDTVNLQQCTVEKIKPVEINICSRKRTFLIPICDGPTLTNYLFSTDSVDDLKEWLVYLNFVLGILIKWNSISH